MDEQENLRPKGGFFGIIITQITVTLIILLSVLAVKYFFKGTYKNLHNWYCRNVLVDTDIEEVLGNEI